MTFAIFVAIVDQAVPTTFGSVLIAKRPNRFPDAPNTCHPEAVSRNPVVRAHMSSGEPTGGGAERRPAIRPRVIAHPSLDDAPMTHPREKEGMVVKLVLILHSSAVDFGIHAARIRKRAGTDGQLVAPLTNFERNLTGRNSLTPWE